MSETESDQDPSIEEILSSIRQIIADDDEEPAAEAEEAPAEPTAEPEPEVAAEPEPEPVEEPKEDVLELTEDMADAPIEESEPEIDMEEANEDDIDALFDEEPAVSDVSEGIISGAVANATIDSLSKLTGNMPVNRREGYDGVTVEDIVRELLNPMLREWVDGNLPTLVERLVQKELEKLARRASDD